VEEAVRSERVKKGEELCTQKGLGTYEADPPKNGEWIHHGHSGDDIIIGSSGTDYITFTHKCSKTKRGDMFETGAWIDEEGHVIINLVCYECGKRDARKTTVPAVRIGRSDSPRAFYLRKKVPREYEGMDYGLMETKLPRFPEPVPFPKCQKCHLTWDEIVREHPECCERIGEGCPIWW
jgi:hypothetical protein